MASISEQRLKEMEAEMNRFEQEIAPADSGGRGMGMIIGSSTFNTVQAQLRQIRNEGCGGFAPRPPPPPPPPPHGAETGNADQPITTLGAPPPPPPPETEDQVPPLLPPPPPPPLINPPAFLPPQLRHRLPLPPRPPMMHHHHHTMGPHGGFGPGPMGPMGPGPYHGPMMGSMRPMGHHMMGPRPMGFHQQQGGFPHGGGYRMSNEGGGPEVGDMTSNPAIIEAKAKVIYSAPPVRNVPKSNKKGKKKDKEGKGIASTDVSADASSSSAGQGVDGEAMSYMGSQQDEAGTADMELEADQTAPTKKEKKEKKKKFLRTAAGIVWEDPTLAEWETDDYRLFCGDLGNEVTDEVLQRAFGKYPTFVRAKVVRDRRSNKTKGYGFVSFKDSTDFIRAIREMNGKYVGNRPIKLRKSVWKDRSMEVVRKKNKEKKRLGMK